MRVTIDPPNHGRRCVLADLGADSVNEFAINGRRLAQIAEFLRGTAVKVFPRGNRRTEVSFRVSRIHASAEDAEIYVLEHELDLPASGLVTFIAQGPTRHVERYMNAGVIESIENRFMGATSFHSYRLIGGVLEIQKPS